MVKNIFDRIVSKLGEVRKEHFPTSREIEKKRLEEEQERRDRQYKIDAYLEKAKEEEIAKEEKEIRESNERFNKIIRGLQSLDPPQLSKEKSLNQQSAKQRLSSLRKYYNRLILQNKELSEAGYKRKYELIDKLKDYRRRARATGNPYFLEHGRFARYIKEAETLIREMPIEIRQVKEKMGKQIKIIKSKIGQLDNDLSSGKFMTDHEIKKRLLKEEKDRLRIERLRDEARKKLFEKEFKAIPEDERIRFISDEVKEFVWRRDQSKCVKCGSQDRLEFDHIIPFSKGGSNTARNIQLLCEKCNRSKHDSI